MICVPLKQERKQASQTPIKNNEDLKHHWQYRGIEFATDANIRNTREIQDLIRWAGISRREHEEIV
jgi:hypothetical protein